jgi:hypothetical protein
MGAQHTPAPWQIGRMQRSSNFAKDTFAVQGGGTILCKVKGGVTEDAGIAEANARLIAAAPALLEALGALVDEFGGSIEQYHKIGPDFTHKDGTETLWASTLLDREPLIEAARAAIAKAEAQS